MRCFFLACFLWPFFSFAQVEESVPSLNTDRPGQSLNPFTTVKRSLLLQAGYSYTNETPRNDVRNFHAADIQLRLGAFERIEFSVSSLFTYENRSSEEIEGGFTEFLWNTFGVNARATLYEGKGVIPAVGLEFGVLSTGRGEEVPFVSGDIRAVLMLAGQISEKFSYTANLARLGGGENYATLNLGYSFADRWSLFGEYVQYFGSDAFLDSFANFGGAFLITGHFQVDLTGGMLTGALEGSRLGSGDQLYLQVGLTKRFNY
jgi:hypothetical protein